MWWCRSDVLDWFLLPAYRPAMSETPPDLRPATADELATTLAFGLRFDGRRRVHHADEAMARITADRLVQHLEQSGFVVMKKPTTAAPTASVMPSPHR